MIVIFPGPMFHTVPPEERLDAGDAELVDVIHTAGRWIGMDGVVGDLPKYNNFDLNQIHLFIRLGTLISTQMVV